MFKKLVNEAKLEFPLAVDTPLLINSGSDSKIRASFDMSPMMTFRNGKEVPYMPGSSIKGVFRSRYEQILAQILTHTNNDPCNILDKNNPCISKKHKDEENGTKLYKESCHACRLFGNLQLGSRISFPDAFPKEDSALLGYRHGVGIDRITGAAHGQAKFEYQMVESGTFFLTATVRNFALYQLRLLLWVLEDIDAGLVTFGMGGTRGNGRMKISDGSQVKLLYLGPDKAIDSNKLVGYFSEDCGGNLKEEASTKLSKSLLGSSIEIVGMQNILDAININNSGTLQEKIKAEDTAVNKAISEEKGDVA